jgi:A/G-specific adenine glycosylase
VKKEERGHAVSERVQSGLASDLLNWYDETKRSLPWRGSHDPYHIWVSEIMLQQTRVDQGMGFYLKFIERFPDVNHLAAASEQEVLALWQGLGYYSRALNLHQSARIIAESHSGCFPEKAADWIKLPGVGVYTASAIASIAFGEPKVAVDGNVLRVVARLTCESGAISDAKVRRSITERAQSLISTTRPGDFNQAMMELGALVCTPKRPKCEVCPISHYCRSKVLDQVHQYPVIQPKVPPREETMWYILYFNKDGLYVQQRGSSSIWRKMWAFKSVSEAAYKTLLQAEIQVAHATPSPELERRMEHRLTHRLLRIYLLPFRCGVGFTDDSLIFVTYKELKNYPFPVVFTKYLKEIGLWEG